MKGGNIMSIQPEIKRVENLSEFNFIAKNAVECKVNLDDKDSALEVFTTAHVCLSFAKCYKNEVRYGGKVIFNVVHGEGLKKTEVGVEFSYKTEVQGVDDGDNLTCDATLENVKLSTVNGIPTLSAAVVLNGRVEKSEEFSYVRKCDGVNSKKEDVENSCIIYSENKKFSLEEEFDTPIVISEVVSHVENVKILGVLCGIGAVSISGEVELSMINLVGEDRKPMLHKEVVPFRFEHEIQKAMPDLTATSFMSLGDVNLKIVVDKNKDKSTVFLHADVMVNTKLYENRQISYMVDAYSVKNELSFEMGEQKLVKINGQRCIQSESVCDGISKISQNSRLIAPLFVKIEQTDIKCASGELEVTGVAEISLLMQNENAFEVQTSNVPFSLSDKSTCSKVDISSIVATGLTASEKDGFISVCFNLTLTVEERDEKTLSYITNIIEGAEKPINTSAISVCIPRKNDSLWELSKALGVSEEEIMSTNPDLTFPLTGEERVVVYREIKN